MNTCLKPGIALLLAITALALGGCAGATTVTRPCCYNGPVLSARLAQIPVQTEDGRRLSFEQAFEGFQPRPALLTAPLPLRELDSADLIYDSLVPLLSLYDANGDGRVEEPEMLVLYAREAALAVGIPVAFFGDPPGAWALSTANADIAGLVAWVNERIVRMKPASRQMFADMQRLGADKRSSAGGMGGDGGEKFIAD